MKLSARLFVSLLLAFIIFFGSNSFVFAEVYYPHTNHQGSIAAITNENGEVVARNSYYPYGNDLSREGNQDLLERGYTGQKKDDKVDIYYYNARYYDPNLSTFLSADITNDQINRYTYVSGNPVMYTDPTGRQGQITDYIRDFIERYGLKDVYSTVLREGPVSSHYETESFYSDLEGVDIINVLKWVGKAFEQIDPKVYQNLILAITPNDFGFATNYIYSDGELINNQNVIGVPALEVYTQMSGKDVEHFYNEFRVYPGGEMIMMTLLHELFHTYQYDNPKADNYLVSVYEENQEYLDSVFYIRGHARSSRREVGPILVTEVIYQNPEAFQVFAPEIYEYVYNLGFFENEVLPKPGTHRTYKGFSKRKTEMVIGM